MDTERNEDLSPRSDDIEEKVRQMLDPSIPDVPNLADVPDNSPDEKPEKVVVIKSSPSPKKNISVTGAPSAPELPSDENPSTGKESEVPSAPLPPSAKSSKKVIIPIDHQGGAASEADGPKNPVPQLVKNKPKAANKVTLKEHDETPEALAEKLDEAIAELEPSAKLGDDTKPEDQEEASPEDTEVANTELDAISNEPKTVGEALEAAADNDDIAIEDPEVITDPVTDKAVAEIIASEGDEILEIEDAARDSDQPLDVKKVKKPRRGLRALLAAAVRKPAFWWAVIFVFLGSLCAVAIVPAARYFVLNTAGVTVSSSLTVVDESTNEPLKNVDVSLGNIAGTTDAEGKVTLSKVRLGRAQLTVNKRAFAPLSKTVVIGLGSNPLGNVSLTPTGTQYTIVARDFLSDQPIAKVAASSGSADATSDAEGVIKITIEKPTDQEFTIDLKRNGYRDEKLTINPDDTAEHTVKFVPAKKHVYVSRRSGNYDIYSAYIDGKDEKVILAGSGNERDDMVLVPHPRDNVVAYISTRPGLRSNNGNILSNILLINLDDGETTNVGSSEQVKVVGWLGDRLVYVHIAPNSTLEATDRYRLSSYNYKEDTTKELAKSNFFNGVIASRDTIYYAPSSAYQSGGTSFYRIHADGTNNEVLHDKEVWNIIRTSYDHVALSVEQEWFDYRLGDNRSTKLNAAPANQIPRTYVDSPDGKRSAWVDSRDGKGVLLTYDVAAKTDKTIRTESSIGYPIRWLTDSILVYRVNNAQETADYAISLNGGEPVKINDVTHVVGLTTWQ